jgi:hypothetical protein
MCVTFKCSCSLLQLLALSKRKDAKSNFTPPTPFTILNAAYLTPSSMSSCCLCYTLNPNRPFFIFLFSSDSLVAGVVVKKNKNGSAKFKVRCSRYLYVCPPSARYRNRATGRTLLFNALSILITGSTASFMPTNDASSGTHSSSTTRTRLPSLSAICPRPFPPVSIQHHCSSIFSLARFSSLYCGHDSRARPFPSPAHRGHLHQSLSFLEESVCWLFVVLLR